MLVTIIYLSPVVVRILTTKSFLLMHQNASKAFDRVNYWCLLKKLHNRNVPVVYIWFLIAWYCTQHFFVRWGNVLCVPFSASNGVRQCGIL